MNLSLQAWIKKIVHREQIHWISKRGKVPNAVVNKEGHADSFVRYERSHYY